MIHSDYTKKKTPVKVRGGKLSLLGLQLFGLSFMFGFFSLAFYDSVIGAILAVISVLCALSSAPVMCVGTIMVFKNNPQYQAQDIDQVRLMGILGLVGGIGFILLSLFIGFLIGAIPNNSLNIILIFTMCFTCSIAISFLCVSPASFHYYKTFKKLILDEEKKDKRIENYQVRENFYMLTEEEEKKEEKTKDSEYLITYAIFAIVVGPIILLVLVISNPSPFYISIRIVPSEYAPLDVIVLLRFFAAFFLVSGLYICIYLLRKKRKQSRE